MSENASPLRRFAQFFLEQLIHQFTDRDFALTRALGEFTRNLAFHRNKLIL